VEDQDPDVPLRQLLEQGLPDLAGVARRSGLKAERSEPELQREREGGREGERKVRLSLRQVAGSCASVKSSEESSALHGAKPAKCRSSQSLSFSQVLAAPAEAKRATQSLRDTYVRACVLSRRPSLSLSDLLWGLTHACALCPLRGLRPQVGALVAKLQGLLVEGQLLAHRLGEVYQEVVVHLLRLSCADGRSAQKSSFPLSRKSSLLPKPRKSRPCCWPSPEKRRGEREARARAERR